MSRREEIESIIVGTLLNDTGQGWYESCKTCVTPSMFQDFLLGEVFRLISEMRQKGSTSTTPYDLCKYRKLSKETILRITSLAIDWHFLAKKTEYNERVWMGEAEHKHYTYVTFDDYISRFIRLQ